MHLTASLSASGHHPAAWRVSQAPDTPSAAHFQALARTAERGRLDAVLLGQSVPGSALRQSGYVNRLQLEPFPLMASLIGVTERIGLAAAWSIDFTEPYNIARVFATLDHLAGGRTGWIVRMLGGSDIAPLFGHAAGPGDGDACGRRAVEFIDVVKRLWDSWEDEAFAVDKQTGMFADPAKVHPLHHQGEFFTIRGPLNVPRPVQGNPIIMPLRLAGRRADMTRQLHLGLFIYPAGHHIAGWRHPTVAPGAVCGFDYYRQQAQLAERGKFDLFFVGDMLAAREKDGRVVAESGLNNLDSISIAAALSAVTERLGFVATLSTTYNEPFYIAERFATLDHISNGRAGWNVITTANDDAAYNFSRKSHMEKTLRYQRAKEFIDVVTGLWDGWDADALAGDREHGLFADPAKIHPIDHEGQFFRVRGALDLPRPVQGWPVLVQAGGSPAGIDFAAQIAEVIFAAQQQLEEARSFRAAVKQRMPQYGRSAETLKVLPGLSPILGSTEAEARRKEEELDDLVLPAVGLWMLSEQMHFRFYDCPLDRPFPTAEIRARGGAFTPRVVSLLDRAERERLTVRQCAAIVARSRSHGVFVGTPEQLVRHMELWLDEEACDGFNIMPAYFPAELEVFVEHAVPELQRRGLFRREYEGATLRDHLGLARPPRRAAR